jgi:hypothetical protein
MAMNATSVMGLPIASVGFWQVTDTAKYRIHGQLVAGAITWGRILRDNRLTGAVGHPQ